jgi:hypothetical protein
VTAAPGGGVIGKLNRTLRSEWTREGGEDGLAFVGGVARRRVMQT